MAVNKTNNIHQSLFRASAVAVSAEHRAPRLGYSDCQ